ncbi:MAG: hypothetical protein EA350_03370 [Gemmatimonadales bacterium]|nr:MAG: hypothetical protein EA350_03370 [Gemmatimonadales bacterium]
MAATGGFINASPAEPDAAGSRDPVVRASPHRRLRQRTGWGLLLCSLAGFFAASLPAQVVATGLPPSRDISGRTMAADGRPLTGVAVTARAEGGRVIQSVDTDGNGSFRMRDLPGEPLTLRFERLGLLPAERSVGAGDTSAFLEVVLTDAVLAIRPLFVGVRRPPPVDQTGRGATARELTQVQIRRLPGLAEADPIRAVGTLPGVISSNDVSAGFNVRGGESDQNAILLDGFPLFSPFHLGGILSVFNPDLVERVEVSTGGFPAEFGGRASSLVRIQSDPGPGSFQVDGGISVLAARLAVGGGWNPGEGEPGIFESMKWRVSARRSYADQILRPVAEFPYHMGDLQAVLVAQRPGGSRWTTSAYMGRDVLDMAGIRLEDFPLRLHSEWRNQMVGTRWEGRIGDGGSAQVHGGLTRFSSSLRFVDFDDSYSGGSIDQWRFGGSATHPVTPEWTLKAGVSVDHYRWDHRSEMGGTRLEGGGGTGSAPALFLQADGRVGNGWRLEPGLRLEGWSGRGEGFELLPAPRLTIHRLLGDGGEAIRVSGGRYVQVIHSLRHADLPLAVDLWIASGEGVPRTVSDQIQLGYIRPFGEGWTASGDLFGRTFEGLVLRNRNADPNQGTDFLLVGSGHGYGADFLLERQGPGVQGSLALTWQKAERSFPDDGAFGSTRTLIDRPADFDRRLDADMVLRLPLPWGWEGGARWHVGSGTPYTLPDGGYGLFAPRQADGATFRWQPTETAVILGPRNRERYPWYHRLDLSVRRTFSLTWGEFTPHLDVLNVYNQRNVLFYYVDYSGAVPTRSGFTMLPILPTIGAEIRFR